MNDRTNRTKPLAARRTIKPGLFAITLTGWLFVLAPLLPAQTGKGAAKPLRIYIVTDLEGASGVYQFAQTREPGPLNEKAKEYLMGDIAAVAGHYGVPTIMVTGDEATCREATKFFGSGCVTVAVKRGISREAAELYPFDETRQALYEGARRAVAAIPQCKPYKLSLPIQAKKEYLVFENPSGPGRRTSKEGTIEDVLKLTDF